MRLFGFMVAAMLACPAFAQACISSAPAAPSQASAFGYTCAILDTQFGTLSSVIDLNDTLAPGFDWYVHNQWNTGSGGGAFWNNGPAIASAQFTNSGSNLVLNAPTNHTAGLMTAAYLGNGQYVGHAIKPGFYVNFEISYASTIPSGITNGLWPAVWATTIEWLTGSLTASNNYLTELDDYEAYSGPGAGNPVSTIMTIHEWSADLASTQANTNNAVTLAGTLSQLHDYGMLVVPMVDNGGTGLIQRYYDSTHESTADCSYTRDAATCPGITRPSALSEIDQMHYVFIMDTGYPNWTMTVSRVTVYCSPTNPSCSSPGPVIPPYTRGLPPHAFPP